MIQIHMLNPFIKNIPVIDKNPAPPIPEAKRIYPIKHEHYSDRFGNQLYAIGPQLTQKYAKLQSFPNQSNRIESDQALEVVRNQQFDFIKQMNEIPPLPRNSFESIEMSCLYP